MGSILDETKVALGLAADYTPFDAEIILHINATLATLSQVGVGPADGFMITDATPTWEEFLGDDARYNQAKAYMHLDVKLRFDPPSVGYVLTSFEKLREEAITRLSYAREEIVHPLPVDPVDPETEVPEVPEDPDDPYDGVIDGGTPSGN